MLTIRCDSTFLLAAALLSLSVAFTTAAADTEKNNDLISQVVEPVDDSQDDSKEKRSREEIMFGNQQNKPSGLVDDIMGMAENQDDDSLVSSVLVPEKKDDNATHAEDDSAKEAKEESDPLDKRTPDQRPEVDDQEPEVAQGSDGVGWYGSNNQQMPPIAMQYMVGGNPVVQRMPSEDVYNGLYDQEDLYRRKRQLLGHPLPLRKRSLRSPLGQMIQTRGRRLPRRSMRLKRQVDVEDLLSLLGEMDNDNNRGRYYELQHAARGPERMSNLNYPEAGGDYGYPYSYIRRVDYPGQEGVMEGGPEGDLQEDMNDADSLMLMPPNSRYVEGPSLGTPYRSRDEENVAIQKWLSKHATPSIFSVSRRSAPLFYPVDYRYTMPGYKKRARNGNTHRYASTDDEGAGEGGQWGQVVAMPEAYATAEDVGRLYALANLMAEGEDEQQMKMRRSA